MFYQIERIAFALSPEEQKKFARWLAAMIDEKDSIQSRLWGYLCENEHLKLLENLDSPHARRWEEISEAIYPQDPKAPGKLEKMRGKLQERLESFLSFQAMQEDPALADTLLLRALLKKVDFPPEEHTPTLTPGQESRHALVNEHIRHVFPIIYDKVEKRLDKTTQRDARYARTQFDRIRTMHKYRVLHKSPVREGARLQDWIAAWTESLRGEWFEFDLHVAAPRAGDKQALADALKPLEAFACLPFSASLLHAGQRDVAQPVSQLYYTLRLLHTSPNLAGETREAFEEFLSRRLKEDRPLFRPDEYSTLHTAVFNYFSGRASETGAYYDVLYDLYTQARDHGIWSVTPLHYFTICTIYAGLCLLEKDPDRKKLYLGEFYQFAQKYASYLLRHQQAETLEYNLALYYFCAGEFERIRGLVYTPEFRNPDYEVRHEILIVRAAYEQKETPSQIRKRIQPLYATTRIKAGLDERRRTGYLNELKMIRQLLNVKTSEAAKALKSHIQKTQPLSGRVWLLLKADERIAALYGPTE